MKEKRQKSDFLEEMVKNYTQEEINKALSALESKDFAKHLTYFMKKMSASDGRVRSLAFELALRIDTRDLVPRFNFLSRYQRSRSLDTASLADCLVKKITSSWTKKQILSHAFYLVDCQRAKNESLRTMAHELLKKIPGKVLRNKINLFMSFQDDKSYEVRKVAASLVFLGLKQFDLKKLNKHIEYLFKCYSDLKGDDKERGEAIELIVSAMETWRPKRLSEKIDFCYEYSHYNAIRAIKTWPRKRQEEKFSFIIKACSGDYLTHPIAGLIALKIVEKWPLDKLSKNFRLLYVIDKALDDSERYRLAVLKKEIKAADLVPELGFLKERSLGLGGNARALSQFFAFQALVSLEPRELINHMEYLFSCIEHSWRFSAQAEEMLLKIESADIAAKFDFLIHSLLYPAHKKIKILSAELLLKIDHNLLVEKLPWMLSEICKGYGENMKTIIRSLDKKVLEERVDLFHLLLENGKYASISIQDHDSRAFVRSIFLKIIEDWPADKLLPYKKVIIACADWPDRDELYAENAAKAGKLIALIDEAYFSKPRLESIKSLLI